MNRARVASTILAVVVCLFGVSAASAQDWQWRDITPTPGETPEARRYGSAIYDPVGGQVIIFGGRGNSGFLNDAWAFNVNTEVWQRLDTSSVAPEPRFGHNAVYDPVGHQMVVWAGQQGTLFFDDTWRLDLASLEWSNVSPAARPAARYGSAAIYDPVEGSLVQFAGFTQEAARFQDTQAFRIASTSWLDITPSSVKPQVRCLHTAARDQSGRMIVYGGQRFGALGDLWAFDIRSRSWTELTPAESPPSRYFSTSFVDTEGSFIIFGGTTSHGNDNDTWAYSFDTGQWRQLEIDSAPSARNGMVGAYVESEDRFIMFGGSAGALLNDVWELGKATPQGEPVTIPGRGAASLTSTVDGGSTVIGHTRIAAGSGEAVPAGAAIVGFRQNGILVTEAGVPPSPLTRDVRIYATLEGPVTTGLAIANPNAEPVSVSFFFTDTDGASSASRTFDIAANSQMAGFLSESPFDATAPFRGTVTLSASLPVSTIALRGLVNERSEFLFTTLPVVRLSATSSETVIIPHFVNGGGWSTRIVLVNPTDSAISGTVEFIDPGSGSTPGQPIELGVDGQTGQSFSYTISERSARRLQATGGQPTARVGSVLITPNAGETTPSALAIFSFRAGGITSTEASISATPAGATFRVYAEVAGGLGQVGSIQSGVAIANPSSGRRRFRAVRPGGRVYRTLGQPLGSPARAEGAVPGPDSRFRDSGESLSGGSANIERNVGDPLGRLSQPLQRAGGFSDHDHAACQRVGGSRGFGADLPPRCRWRRLLDTAHPVEQSRGGFPNNGHAPFLHAGRPAERFATAVGAAARWVTNTRRWTVNDDRSPSDLSLVQQFSKSHPLQIHPDSRTYGGRIP